MNHPEHRTEVEDGGNQRRLGDFHERHVDGFGHDEGNGAHYRRHYLAAHARSGLDPAGKRGPVAKALHQRNGELSRGHDVGNPGAGDGPHQRRRSNGHLRRAAELVPEQSHGEVGKQLDHAGLFKKGAEQNEQKNVGRRNVGRRPVQPFGSKRQLIDDLVEAIAAMGQVAR
ncbi:hypothetical protein D3C86_1406870 [compost metagenome]